MASVLRCRHRRLDLDRPHVMGVVNATPDSFSDGGRLFTNGRIDPRLAAALGEAMLAAGASLLDVGGESTRPGAAPVGEAEELDRVIPVVERLASLDTIVSVDTSRAAVAMEALARGATMINDVRGGRDRELLDAVARSRAAICIMHMRGEPETMQDDPHYDDVVREVRDFLVERAAACRRAGIDGDRIVLDPGFGFGKRLEHNVALLTNLDALTGLGFPILVGLSRKGMIGALTERPVGARATGSAAAAMLAVQRGAAIVRAHDVAETVDALRMLDAVENGVSRRAVSDG